MTLCVRTYNHTLYRRFNGNDSVLPSRGVYRAAEIVAAKRRPCRHDFTPLGVGKGITYLSLNATDWSANDESLVECLTSSVHNIGKSFR
jgi:hypothetical protein